jgi:hypothetical protein
MLSGRYRIVALLSRGGMGEVYRAEDVKLGQGVALKFLPRDLAADRGKLQRLYEEVRLERQVSHPNVCRLYDVGDWAGATCFRWNTSMGKTSRRSFAALGSCRTRRRSRSRAISARGSRPSCSLLRRRRSSSRPRRTGSRKSSYRDPVDSRRFRPTQPQASRQGRRPFRRGFRVDSLLCTRTIRGSLGSPSESKGVWGLGAGRSDRGAGLSGARTLDCPTGTQNSGTGEREGV